MIKTLLIIFFTWYASLVCVSAEGWIHVQDDADLLTQETKQSIQEMAAQFHDDTKTVFLLKTDIRSDLSLFKQDSTNAFANFIRNVPKEKGMLLYFQMKRNSQKGKVNFSAGYGLQGAFQMVDVRRILQDKILHFRHNMADQKVLVEGIGEYFLVVKNHKTSETDSLGPSDTVKIGTIQTGLSKKSLFWLLIGLFASLVLVTVFYIVGKRRCPECGSRLHVNIRPLYRTDSPYKRIKIIKCFDCNYFRKYLF
tara:strand:- start:5 stop:760 length:756 start_codon:yes stop_codon:yes gene_type:complete